VQDGDEQIGDSTRSMAGVRDMLSELENVLTAAKAGWNIKHTHIQKLRDLGIKFLQANMHFCLSVGSDCATRLE